MSERKAIAVLLEQLDRLAPMGYTVGLHIRFATPLIYKSSYPASWVDHYNSHSYYLRDPLVFWGVGVEGTTRWSAIRCELSRNASRRSAATVARWGAARSIARRTNTSASENGGLKM